MEKRKFGGGKGCYDQFILMNHLITTNPTRRSPAESGVLRRAFVRSRVREHVLEGATEAKPCSSERMAGLLERCEEALPVSPDSTTSGWN